MKTIGGRHKVERECLGLSQMAMAQVGGVGTTSPFNYEKNGRHPDAAYLSVLDGAGINVQYVLTGRRDRAQQARTGTSAPDGGSRSPNIAATLGTVLTEVNLHDVNDEEGAAGAGRSREVEAVAGVIHFPEAELAALGIAPGQVAGVKVRDDSMHCTLADGDWVLVDLANRDPRREGVFLLWVSGERRIKRVQRLAGGALYLISDNDHYQPEMIRPEEMRDMEILGRCEIRIGKIS